MLIKKCSWKSDWGKYHGISRKKLMLDVFVGHGTTVGREQSEKQASIPLCLDVDGTILATDLLIEGITKVVKQRPGAIPGILASALTRKKVELKTRIASLVDLNMTCMPMRQGVLDLIKKAREEGREIVLATAAHHSLAEAVAKVIGGADEIFATDGKTNLRGEAKTSALVERYGEGGYDMAGDSAADASAMRKARQAIAVGSPATWKKRLGREPDIYIDVQRAGLKDWARAIRVKQWMKNVLVLLPVLLSGIIPGMELMTTLALALGAMCLGASSIYLINDVLDLEADRQHPRKKNRPIAAGLISVPKAVFASSLLLTASFACAALIGLAFVAVVLTYLITTTLYSFRIKAIPILDVATLSGLYTIRIIAGGIAAEVILSAWLLAFSVTFFFGLATMKRYAEVREQKENHRDGTIRGYQVDDEPVLLALGVGASLLSALVMALWIVLGVPINIYAHVAALWGLPAIVLLWSARMWLLTGRGIVDDDPVEFAIRDHISWVATIIGGGLVAFAQFT